ncbi:transposon Tf2-9 polyprotein [Trichonephila clavipes]|nr:transposon Tf2-9 polyprotein [Trichonephila clavipes]
MNVRKNLGTPAPLDENDLIGVYDYDNNEVEAKRQENRDLYNLASELRVSVTLEDKIIDLREKITSCTFFQNNEQVVKEMLDNIVDERKSLEIEALKKIEREDKCLADQRAFELEKLKLQAQNPPASVGTKECHLDFCNAPATFQRLMDQFRNGLPNVNILVYLDDIVVLSETFEQHIEEIRMVFDRLKKFKLCANREKMQVCLLPEKPKSSYSNFYRPAYGIENSSRIFQILLDPLATCQRKNALDTKPLIRNLQVICRPPVPAQRFESIAVDLLVPYQKQPKSTDHTAAYLTFARELRTLDQVNTDLRSVIHNDNFVPEFTPYLKRFEGYMSQIKENIEMSQDRQKTHMQINHADQVLTIKLMIWYG